MDKYLNLYKCAYTNKVKKDVKYLTKKYVP